MKSAKLVNPMTLRRVPVRRTPLVVLVASNAALRQFLMQIAAIVAGSPLEDVTGAVTILVVYFAHTFSFWLSGAWRQVCALVASPVR